MRAIDADALIDDLKHDVAVDQDSLDYEELTDSNREKIQFDKDCKQNAIDLLQNAPTIETRCETCEAFNKTRLLVPQPQRKQEKCIWCDSPFRIEYYWIDREGCTASFADEDRHMVATGIAKYCPNCGRPLNAEMTEGEE